MGDVTLNDRYRLQSSIGSGGMATVYKGLDMLLQRPVAVKVLRERFADDPEFLERFQREARAAANLDHPSIATVHDVGKDGDRHYIVMEYVDGQDLKTLIRQRGRLSVREALEIVTQIAAGVGHAHKANVIHRDIKPQNVLVTPDGRAKVVDFGIARALSESGLTDSNTVWGSPVYFSPEQAAGDPPTPASDVYSIGVVLYEMLAGSPPFQADTPTGLAMKHLRDEPPPLAVRNPLVPQRLEWIVRKLLSKEPSARYRTAEQLVHVLEEYRMHVEQPTGWQEPVSRQEPTPWQQPAGSSPTSVSVGDWLSDSEPVTIQAATFGSEALTWVLGVVALVAVVGLIPLWWLVYRSYAAVPTGLAIPTPTALVTPTREPVNVAVLMVIDRPVEEARTLLRRAGLELEVKEERDQPGVPQGTVIEQDPPAGESVPTGTKVFVVISGPGRELVMPDVVGRPAGEMQKGLESMGLNVVVETSWSSEAEGQVTAQQPEPDATVRSGETVTLTVAGGSEIALSANLDNRIQLKGAVMQQRIFSPGEMLGIALRWEANRAVDERYVVFVHLIGPDGSLVTQDDRQPHLHTTQWNPGIEIVDPHQLTIPAVASPGRYQLRTGMYPDGQPGSRLAVIDPGLTTEEANSILVVEIDLVP